MGRVVTVVTGLHAARSDRGKRRDCLVFVFGALSIKMDGAGRYLASPRLDIVLKRDEEGHIDVQRTQS